MWLYIPKLKRTKTIQLSRFIMNAKDDEVVDHVDFNTLNNKKENLRVTKFQKNTMHRNGANSNNKTGVRNVHLVSRYGGHQVYLVQLCKNYQRFCWEFSINQFDEACKFAKEKRKEIYGEFAGRS